MSTLYREPGSSAWPLLWGPAFALVGYLLELLAGLRPHTAMWLLAGAGLLLLSAVWVYARRRFLVVEVSRSELRQGPEHLPATRIAGVAESADVSTGTRVLGGGLSVPRKFDELPVLLDDGTVVLAWARDGEALRTALERVRQA